VNISLLALTTACRLRHCRTNIVRQFGKVSVEVGPIPYAATFGFASQQRSIAEMVAAMGSHQYPTRNMSTSTAPPTVFASLRKDHPLMPLVQVSCVAGARSRGLEAHRTEPATWVGEQVPHALQPSVTNITSMKTQFYIGDRGTGAPPHFHRAAWNALVHGKKLWALWPPPQAVYSTRHPASFMPAPQAPRQSLAWASAQIECVQHAGDVLFVPDAWGHAVLNVEPSVGFAQEVEWGGSEFSL